MKTIRYNNAVIVKMHNRKVCVSSLMDNSGDVIIEMLIYDNKEASIPRAIHTNLRDRAAKTGFKVTREAAASMAYAIVELLKMQDENK